MPKKPPTVREVLHSLREIIGGDSPALDASLITAHILGCSREKLFLEPDMPVTSAQNDSIHHMAKLRSSGYALAYLVGSKEFFGHDFIIDQRVLVPRPDTEVLVETAIDFIKKHLCSKKEPQVLDLCCGSGCIGISVAAELPNINLTLADIDQNALEIARANAQRILAKTTKTDFIHSDLLQSVNGRFDVILSNPPYVSTEEFKKYSMERWGEPRHALVAGSDGLEIISRLADTITGSMCQNGLFAMEAADHQADFISRQLKKQGFHTIRHILDLAGRKRVTAAQWPKN